MSAHPGGFLLSEVKKTGSPIPLITLLIVPSLLGPAKKTVKTVLIVLVLSTIKAFSTAIGWLILKYE